MSDAVDRVPGADFDPFAGPVLERIAPSTEAQREIWTATRLGDDANTAFNESCSLSLEGPLDALALAAAVADLMARHEATRATLSPDGTTLCIARDVPLTLEIVDLAGMPEPRAQEQLAGLLDTRVRTPFALESGPLFRFDLVRTAPERHVLLLTAHHVVCDGFSTGVLLRDLAHLYSSRRQGRQATLPPAFPFSRHAAEQLTLQGTPAHAEDERFWVSRFSGGTVPTLELPYDRPRPRVKTYPSRRYDTLLPAALVGAVKKAGKRAGASLFATLLAALDVLLARLSGQDDLVVGVASAGQVTTGHTDLVGHCVNTLPIRTRVDRAVPFTALLRRVKEELLDAQEHSQYTFGSLVRQLALPRDPSRLPLVSVFFNLDPGLSPDDLLFDGLRVAFRSHPRCAENFDLFLNAVEAAGELQLECQYNTDLFDDTTIRRWVAALARLLGEIAEHPDTPVGRIPILPPEDERQLAEWNETGRDWPRDRLLHELVEDQADRTPESLAVQADDASLTYAQLDGRANQLAHHLRALGAGPDVLVGIALERTAEMMIALLGVHKAGAAYVPLDPAFPAERLSTIVSDSGMPLLVTQRSLRPALPTGQARVIEVDGTDAAAISAQRSVRPPRAGSPDATAYVLYTSGSTGKPKGVQVPVSALVNLLWSARQMPGLGARDRMVAIATLSFDIAEVELWVPLLVGSTVVLASREVAQDGAQLLALMRRSGAGVLQATPATWRILLEAGWTGGPGFRAISTGEALPRELALRLVEHATVFDMYGPTETTIWSTGYRLPRPLGAVLIGRPLDNQRAHVLDALGQPVPIGVPGELYLAGEGVARGYLGRPDLTAERFVPDPFAGVAGARMYRTGDVVRQRSDGNLEYLGRNDHQVKVRGFRIELGEIEAALMRHPSVAQAVAAAREHRAGDARLAAYVVVRAGADFSEDALRRHLKGILPDYMVPQHLMRLDTFPLTSNGKIDRKALPVPEATRSPDAGFLPPRTDAERLVAQLWQEALGVGRLGVNDDFFALGGHSLLAAQVIVQLARQHGISVPLRRMFEAPTVATFAPLLEAARPAVRIPTLAGDGPAPVSFMQERIWNLDQLRPGRAVFNLPAAFRLRGALDAAALQRSLDAFAARHEAVRSTLLADGGTVLQRVAPELHVPLERHDLSATAADRREAALTRELLAASVEPFDLQRGPLVRARLYQLGPEEHVFFFLPHHAIWDGWSFDVLLRDLSELYAAEVERRPARLPDLPVRYRDFSAWHRSWLQSPEVQEQAEWWRNHLSGDAPALGLPTDRPRHLVPDDAGETVWVEIPQAEMEALSALARENGATPFMAMLAVFQIVLHRWSGQDEVLVGTPIRGRSHPGLDDMVGTFINTLLLRTRVSDSQSFLENLARVRTTVADAFAHEDVPFELLTMGRKPAFRALFSFQDVRTRPGRFGDVSVSQVHVLPPVAANDVSLWLMQREVGVTGGFNFSTALFDRSTAQAMLAGFRTVLRSAIADPRSPVHRLDRTGPPARMEGGPAPSPEVLHAAFEQLLDADPTAPALLGATGPITRRDLDAQARRLENGLRAAGAGPQSRVALQVETASASVAALLAISRIGAAAFAIDAGDPPARAARTAALVRPTCGVSLAADLAEALACPLVAPADPAEQLPRPDHEDLHADAPALIAVLSDPLGAGEPVALQLPHRAVAAAANGVRAACELGNGDALAIATEDPARLALGIWLALRSGAALAQLERDELAEAPAAAVQRSRATALLADPDVWLAILERGFQAGPRFIAICAGESIAPELEAKLRAAGRAILVHGGPEGGFWYAARETDGATAGQRPRLGTPLPGTVLAAVDLDLEPVPPGVVGELAVWGPTLALGYLGRAEGRLADDPGRAGARVLRTGDRVRQRPDGWFELLGRLDAVVTVGGRRVDLAEVERAVRACPGVADAAVALSSADAGDAALIAWWTAAREGEADDIALRRRLRRVLPRYMVPRELIELDRIPRLRGGALDRAALPARQRGDRRATSPQTPEEILLAGLWCSALGLPEVSIQDNFFELGGHSLLCLQMVEQVAQRTGRRIPPAALLQDTLQAVAARLGRDPART